MATIGTFTKTENGGFTGTVTTLALHVKARISPAEKANDKAPDFRVFAGPTEFGAAWKKKSNEGREYLSVKLDDPSFPAPIYARWLRSRAKTASRSSGPAAAATEPPWLHDAPPSGGAFSAHGASSEHCSRQIASMMAVAVCPCPPSTRSGYQQALRGFGSAQRGLEATRHNPDVDIMHLMPISA
jgi:uncharacterized protein (DUF736 family)